MASRICQCDRCKPTGSQLCLDWKIEGKESISSYLAILARLDTFLVRIAVLVTPLALASLVLVVDLRCSQYLL